MCFIYEVFATKKKPSTSPYRTSVYIGKCFVSLELKSLHFITDYFQVQVCPYVNNKNNVTRCPLINLQENKIYIQSQYDIN
jgi:hypothetical protein